MKTFMLIFFAFIFLLPVSLAETKIFSGKVITDIDKVIDGKTFRFSYAENTDKMFIQTPAASIIVENGNCKSGDMFRVCVNSVNFSYKNVSTYKYYYEANVDVYELTGSLSAKSKSSKTELLQGEESAFEITLTNPTNFDMTNIIYEENLTPFFVKYVSGCSLEDSRISWQGSLKSNYDKTCTATIVAQQKEGNYNLKGKLSYYNRLKTENITTDTLTIKVLPKRLKAISFIDNYIEVKHPFHLNISLQNMDKEQRLEISSTIEFPSSINIKKADSAFAVSNKIFTLRTTIDPSASKNFSFYLEAESTVTDSINQKFSYTLNNVFDGFENSSLVEIFEPKPFINISSEYAEITPGQKFIVVASIKNPSKFHEITNIQADLSASYNESIKQNLDKLAPNETYSLFSHTLTAPQELQSSKSLNQTITLNMSIGYYLGGAAKSLSKTLELRISNNLSKSDSNHKFKTNQPIQTNPENKLLNNKFLYFGIAAVTIIFTIAFSTAKIKKWKLEREKFRQESVK